MLSNVNSYNIKPEWFIGKGSFGSVYKAEKAGKFYAIKVFQTELLQTAYKDRIDREIKALQKITHPNVVKIYDFGKFKDNEFEYFYIVMDFIEGKSLTEYVGGIDEKKCIEIVESVVDTIEAIHSQGVIHRDLKPANIVINQKGAPIILDFGLAKLIDYSSITQTGDRVGTFYYMSPEQITDSKNIDSRSDYFSIGVIFYELITGARPYDAMNLPALVDQIKNVYPKNPSELNSSISNHIENVILRLLEKSPYKRYQTTREIKNALRSIPEKRKRKIDIDVKFFVRLLHNDKTVFMSALDDSLLDRIIFPANFFTLCKPTVQLIRKTGVSFTTDPATNRLPYPAFSKTKGIRELPYSSGDEVIPIQKKDFHSILQVQEYVKKVLEFQIQNGVTELAAPFFFAKNSSDEWFNINIKLLKESIAYRDQFYSKMPIWGGICMNVDNWHDEEEKSRILNHYVKTEPDGFFIYGDPIANTSNLVQLYHYTDLSKKLQTASAAPVVACRINGLGLILICLGISGISSGIAVLDNFREPILSDAQEGYSNDPRYYIPELLSMITLKKKVATKLTDIAKSSIANELKCNCKYCRGIYSGTPLTQRNMKLHFLTRRKQELEEIKKIPYDKRINYIEEKVNLAMKYARTLSNEGIEVGDFSHLTTWKGLIENFKKKNS